MIDDNQRRSILEKIVNFDDDLYQLEHQLSAFEFDIDDSLVVVTRENLEYSLNSVFNEESLIPKLIHWANILEVRDDIDYKSEVVQQIIIELANPTLYNEVSLSSINELLNRF